MIDASDTKYILECQKWKLEAYGYLYERYAKRVYDFLYYRTFDERLSEDLTSTTFLKGLEHIESFRLEANHSTLSWFLTIARNSHIDHTRTKAASDISLDEQEEAGFCPSYTPDFATDADNKDRLEQVQWYLNTLDADTKEVLLLRIWNDCSYEEIAQITWKTSQSARQIVSRTLKKIAANVGVFFFFVLLATL